MCNGIYADVPTIIVDDIERPKRRKLYSRRAINLEVSSNFIIFTIKPNEVFLISMFNDWYNELQRETVKKVP
jgi:hypothetical protein